MWSPRIRRLKSVADSKSVNYPPSALFGLDSRPNLATAAECLGAFGALRERHGAMLPRTQWRSAFALCIAALGSCPSIAPAMGDAFVPMRGETAPPSGAVALCGTYEWACALGGSPLSRDQIDLANRISRSVNRRVREISDQAQYGHPEQWALPTARGGDCEDFALLKKRELIARGLPANRLLIASVFDRRRNSHAVLVLRTDRGDFVLDNLTDRIAGWRESGYTFFRIQDPSDPRRWMAVLAGGFMSE